jgi:hypothetical protein
MKELARPGDPYVTARGLIIQPDPMVEGEEPVAETVTVENFKPTKRRDVKDLPAPPNMIKAIACAFMFSVFGISDRETASALGIKAEDLKHIKDQPAYKECFDAVAEEFINANSDLINARLAAYAHGALSQVHKISVHGKEEKNRFRASADILDRGGYAPKENAARGGMTKNDLRIVLIKADRDVELNIGGE